MDKVLTNASPPKGLEEGAGGRQKKMFPKM